MSFVLLQTPIHMCLDSELDIINETQGQIMPSRSTVWLYHWPSPVMDPFLLYIVAIVISGSRYFLW